jgi:hypothetical protein
MNTTSPQHRVQSLLDAAQEEAKLHPAFFITKGPGAGDHSTAAYIAALRKRLHVQFGSDLAEHPILPGTGIRVDYWLPEEQTIVEIALGLKNPLSEFERDVLKAVVSRATGLQVNTLVLLGKPGAFRRMESPWFKHVRAWAKEQGVTVLVHELRSESAV